MMKLGIMALAAGALMAVTACSTDERMVDTEYDPGFDMLASQNYAAAETFFAGKVAEDPDDPYAHLNLAAAQEAQGNYAMAASHYQDATRLGDGVTVGKTVYNGQVKMEETTVAALAAYNLANLPQ